MTGSWRCASVILTSQRLLSHSRSAWLAAGAAQTRSFAGSSDAFGALPALPQRRVVVTGIGLVTPLGVGVDATWASLVAGGTGVRRLEPEDLPQEHRHLVQDLPSQVVACVPKDQLAASPFASSADPKRTAPFMAYALCAAAEALSDARWSPSDAASRAATGVCIGAGMSSCAEIAAAGSVVAAGKLRRLSPYFVPRVLINMAAGAVGIQYGLQGPNHAPSTACATGAHAIGDAFRMVQRGDADVMVAGATEASIDAISIAGFCRLKALSSCNEHPERASRPFDAGRDGFVMGEGAGVLVLEELGHAVDRGAHIYAEVRGYGLSGDGHHITQPHPEGTGATLAMRAAIANSGVPQQRVRYINAHATSTPMGDLIELNAIVRLFAGGGSSSSSSSNSGVTGHGDRASSAGADNSSNGKQPDLSAASESPSSAAPSTSGQGMQAGFTQAALQRLAVSSTKGATGHLLGAAGAVESAFTILALHHRLAPPTLNLHDPQQPLEHLPVMVGLGGSGALTLEDDGQPTAVLCNSFGFGGTNASLLFASPPT